MYSSDRLIKKSSNINVIFFFILCPALCPLSRRILPFWQVGDHCNSLESFGNCQTIFFHWSTCLTLCWPWIVCSKHLWVEVSDQCAIKAAPMPRSPPAQEKPGPAPPTVQLQSAEEATASGLTVPLRLIQQLRAIARVTLFTWPFTWQQETGRVL